MKKTPTSKKVPASAANEDPRFTAVIDALAADPRFKEILDAYAAGKKEPGRKFGSNGLKVNGKLFAMSVRGKLVVKLPKERVDSLVASGLGERFDPGHGRLMKEWIEIAGTKPPWVELVKEAHDFVKGTHR
jgi:hypothetical protein